MQLDHLRMPPFNTTMMGVIKGVLDYYRIPMSDAAVFGGSGHAFMINIHKDLCPSSPYCWKREPFLPLVRNLGLEMNDQGFFGASCSLSERSALEALLKRELDEGHPCSFLNLENQLITGYDDTGFLLAQPWPQMGAPVTPARLTFGSWAEFGDSVFPIYFTFRKGDPVSEPGSIAASLRYGIDVYRHPHHHATESYGVGEDAYTNWIAAVRAGQGGSHGNWWNGTVWSECRRMAAGYFDEIAARHAGLASPAAPLAGEYRQIGELLARVSDKELPADEKVSLLESARTHEASTVRLMEIVASQLS